MTTRTTRTTVTFTSAFSIARVPGQQQAGDYRVDHDEEAIEGLSVAAYRRVATFLYLPAIGADTRTSQMIAIDPMDLEDALERDRSSL